MQDKTGKRQLVVIANVGYHKSGAGDHRDHTDSEENINDQDTHKTSLPSKFLLHFETPISRARLNKKIKRRYVLTVGVSP